nr:alpha methylacyl coenzyme A racemase [Hymenolepis microstoma]
MLKGINVLEMAGLGPVTMCGLILKDFGASVLRIINPDAPFIDHLLSPGKASVELNLRNVTDKEKFISLCKTSDILLDPFRPNCLEKLGITPQLLHKVNRGLILTRISGYGQPDENENMDYYLRPGHDINYLAESGILSILSSEKGTSNYPINGLADIAGGSFPAVAGTILALYSREKSGEGKIVDVSITDGMAYLATYFMASLQGGGQDMFDPSNAHWLSLAFQCQGLLNGNAPFYRTYETKDKKAVAVGALEPKFYSNLLRTLGVAEKYAPQLDRHAWPRIIAIFSGIFAGETRDYWCTQTDLVRNACLSPVYSMEEVLQMRPKHLYRDLSFSFSPLAGATRNEGAFSFRIPRPSPILYDFPPE